MRSIRAVTTGTLLAVVAAVSLSACNEPAYAPAAAQEQVVQEADDGIGSELLAAGAGAAVGYMAGKSSQPKYGSTTIIKQRVIVNKGVSPRYAPRYAPRYSAPAPKVSAPSRSYRPSFRSRRR